jgi:hypothetical protein
MAGMATGPGFGGLTSKVEEVVWELVLSRYVSGMWAL